LAKKTVRNNIGDMPTMKLSQEELARYAREADQLAVQAESAAQRATFRPAPVSYPDIDVSVEIADPMTLEGLGIEEKTSGASTMPPRVDDGSEDRASDVRIAASGDASPSADGPDLQSVPCVVASKEDLSWFELEDASNIVLGLIDGESTVEAIVSTLSIPRANALAILRELKAHGVIEFH
jgi:hypothetical protein